MTHLCRNEKRVIIREEDGNTMQDFKDYLMDEKLHIRTTEENRCYSDTYRYAYEPTSYSVLERLCESGFVGPEDVLLDYGCGMGRVPIYLNNQIGCRAIGVEMVEEFYEKACENGRKYKRKEAVRFVQREAEKYEVPTEVTACFFFNPFSIEIMRRVMERILDSYYEMPRRIRLFFYYPQREYIAYLMGVDALEFVDEIDCMDLFAGRDDRNRVILFETTV